MYIVINPFLNMNDNLRVKIFDNAFYKNLFNFEEKFALKTGILYYEYYKSFHT